MSTDFCGRPAVRGDCWRCWYRFGCVFATTIGTNLLKVFPKFVEICKYSTTVGGIRTPKNIPKRPNLSSYLEDYNRACMFSSYMDVSENSGTPKSSIMIGFSIIFTIPFGVPLIFWKHPYRIIIQSPEVWERLRQSNLRFRAEKRTSASA